MTTPMRMKQKLMNKIHLDTSGVQTISVVKSSSDAASKGVSAQPANLLTQQETSALPGGASVTEAATTNEQGTGAPLERVDPSQHAAELEAEGLTPTTEEATATAGATTGTKQTLEAKLSSAGETAELTTEPAKDPNAQKEATTVAPNTGPGTIVAMTEEKAVTETEK